MSVFLVLAIFRRRQWYPTLVLLPGKSHGRRSLVGCSPWGLEESDTTEQLQSHFSLSCIGEGNGNPLQCSCLENSRDDGAWWAAVYGVAQSQARLKRLSSSSSSILTDVLLEWEYRILILILNIFHVFICHEYTLWWNVCKSFAHFLIELFSYCCVLRVFFNIF